MGVVVVLFVLFEEIADLLERFGGCKVILG